MTLRPSRANSVVDEIGAQLRAMYEQVLHEPLPDRFSDLLNTLETDLNVARLRMIGDTPRQSKERKRRVG